MNRYRVKVESWIVVEARNVTDAKAKAELAHRKTIEVAYMGTAGRFSEPWELYGWQAKKAERINDDNE